MSNELLTLRQQGHKVTYIPAFNYGYDFYSSVCFVTDIMIRKQPELVRKFLEVSLRGWEEAFENAAETAQLVVEKYYPEGSVPHETESLKILEFVARLGEGRKRLGWMEERYWAKGIDILHRFRQTDGKIPATDVFTPKFLESFYFGNNNMGYQPKPGHFSFPNPSLGTHLHAKPRLCVSRLRLIATKCRRIL